MKYRNTVEPEIAQPSNEGRSFLILLLGAGLVVAGVIGALALFSEWLAPRIPFAAEKALLASTPNLMPSSDKSDSSPAALALKALAGRVAANMDFPPDFQVAVHYRAVPTVNAMATLGGHIFVYRGLIEKIDSEEALAFVLAHEMGHVKERHVIRALSRGLMVVTALNALGIKSSGINQWALGKGAEVGNLAYSREAESAADAQALSAICRIYGNAGGALALFDLFSRLGDGGVEMLHSHPLSEHRKEEMIRRAGQAGCPVAGVPHPLDAALRAAGVRKDVSGNNPAASRNNAPD